MCKDSNRACPGRAIHPRLGRRGYRRAAAFVWPSGERIQLIRTWEERRGEKKEMQRNLNEQCP